MVDQPRNVIYLVADSLRPGTLGCYGNDDNITTTIDELAQEGVRFEDVVSAAPWTIPSVKSHVTGKYPHDIGLFDDSVEEGPDLFGYFSDHGYETACFYDSDRRTELFPENVDRYGWSYDLEAVLDFITDSAEDQFFIFDLYRGTHLPYTLKYSSHAWRKAKEEMMAKIQSDSPEELEGIRRRYNRSVERFSEWYLGAIVDRLDREGILEETAIIVTGDHGESWGDRFETQSEVDLFDLHGTLLYEEVLSVPLVTYNLFPETSATVSQMVRSVDVLPTLSSALGLPPMRDDLDGCDLTGVISGSHDDVPELAFSSTTTHDQFGGVGESEESELSGFTKFSVRRDDGWKLISNVDEGTKELYDLTADPGETDNLIEENEKVAETLESALREEFDNHLTGRDASEEVRSQLEDLGYI